MMANLGKSKLMEVASYRSLSRHAGRDIRNAKIKHNFENETAISTSAKILQKDEKKENCNNCPPNANIIISIEQN